MRGLRIEHFELHFARARAGRIVLHERDETVTEAAAVERRIDAERAKPRRPLIECRSPNRADNNPIEKSDGRLSAGYGSHYVACIGPVDLRPEQSGLCVRVRPVHKVGYDRCEGHILGDVRLEPSDN